MSDEERDWTLGRRLPSGARRIGRRQGRAEQGEAANRLRLARRQVKRDDSAERMSDDMGMFLPVRGESAQRRLHWARLGRESVHQMMSINPLDRGAPRA